LATGEVRLHRAGLDVGPALLRSLEALLDETERTRASALRPARCRRRFIAAHGFLRRILALHTGMAPQELRFARDPLGKPSLAAPAAGLCFSMSYSGALALFAIAREREVGVDVEESRPLPALGIARRCFSGEEAEALAALDEGQRTEAFLRMWTRREALGKARAHGLLSHREATVAGPWQVTEIDAGPGYVAALALAARRATSPLVT
jgi:4'-phosphopantetheinyl transferase